MKGNDYKKIMNSRRKRRAINKKIATSEFNGQRDVTDEFCGCSHYIVVGTKRPQKHHWFLLRFLVMSKHQMILEQVLQRHIQILEIPTQSTLPSADRMR